MYAPRSLLKQESVKVSFIRRVYIDFLWTSGFPAHLLISTEQYISESPHFLQGSQLFMFGRFLFGLVHFGVSSGDIFDILFVNQWGFQPAYTAVLRFTASLNEVCRPLLSLKWILSLCGVFFEVYNFTIMFISKHF